MASMNKKAYCVTCGKETGTSKCAGCSQDFCYKHLGDHRQELSRKLDDIEITRDIVWETLNEQKSQQSQEHSSIEQINKWENDSIEKIRQIAEELRQSVHQHLNQHFLEIENKLNQLTYQLQQCRIEDNFLEIDLHRWNTRLTQLIDEVSKPSKIEVSQSQVLLIKKLCLNIICDEGKIIEGDMLLVSNPVVSEFSTIQLTESNFPQADPQLVRSFKSSINDSEIIKYIREHMNPNEKFYIRNIVLSYLEACLINRDPQKKIQEDIVKRRMTVLNTIIEHKPEAEIQAVYAIQNFVSKLEHPPKMARLLFDIFYDEECVSTHTFFQWLKYPDQSEIEGHAIVEMSTKDFFAWLQQAEIEVEEGN